MDEIFVVLNPAADRGGGANAEATITQAFQEVGLSCELEKTSQAGGGIALARQARQAGYRWIGAAGGDGTLNEVVNGIVQATPQDETVGCLVPLPFGSANDFADMAGYTRDLGALANRIKENQTRHIDLCHADIQSDDGAFSRFFINNLGFGFEAQVTTESNKIQWLRGDLIYLAAVVRALGRFEQPSLSIRWEDEQDASHSREQSSLLISVGNGRRTGGSFFLTPDAAIDDGLLELLIANKLNVFQILRLLPMTLTGAHRGHPQVLLTKARNIQVESNLPVPVHTDGEVMSEKARSVALSIEPGRLEIIAA